MQHSLPCTQHEYCWGTRVGQHANPLAQHSSRFSQHVLLSGPPPAEDEPAPANPKAKAMRMPKSARLRMEPPRFRMASELVDFVVETEPGDVAASLTQRLFGSDQHSHRQCRT